MPKPKIAAAAAPAPPPAKEEDERRGGIARLELLDFTPLLYECIPLFPLRRLLLVVDLCQLVEESSDGIRAGVAACL